MISVVSTVASFQTVAGNAVSVLVEIVAIVRGAVGIGSPSFLALRLWRLAGAVVTVRQDLQNTVNVLSIRYDRRQKLIRRISRIKVERTSVLLE